MGFGGDLCDDSNNSVQVFAPGASGNATPLRSITGSNTGLTDTDDLAVDRSRKHLCHELQYRDHAVMLGPGANGNVAPAATIAGSLTTFSEPEGVAVAGAPITSSATLSSKVASPSITLGSSTNDAATLAGGTSPSGSLIFKLFGPGDPTCKCGPGLHVTPHHGDRRRHLPVTVVRPHQGGDLQLGRPLQRRHPQRRPVEASGDPTRR